MVAPGAVNCLVPIFQRARGTRLLATIVAHDESSGSGSESFLSEAVFAHEDATILAKVIGDDLHAIHAHHALTLFASVTFFQDVSATIALPIVELCIGKRVP
jgi:hypothetical protein